MLLDGPRSPCVSLYMQTQRGGPQTRQNPIRFKSLLQQAHDELAERDKRDAQRLLERAAAIADDHDFWQHQLEALAFFADAEQIILARLPRRIARDLVAVADSFHVKPLIRAMQGVDRYQLLAITQKSVALYEGDRDHLDPVPLHPGVPRSLVDALGPEVSGSLNVSHYGGLLHKGMFHGHHDNRDDRDQDLERFFRVVDKAIYDYHGKGADLPLFLAADVDYHDRYRKVSHHPRLEEEGIRINPDAVEVTPQRLHEEMKRILIPRMHRHTRQLIEQFGTAKSRGLGSDELPRIAEAAAQGRVSILMTDADRRVGGRVGEGGLLELAPESDPSIDDVLDDLSEMTLRAGGRVLVMPGAVHPAGSGAAAIFRY